MKMDVIMIGVVAPPSRRSLSAASRGDPAPLSRSARTAGRVGRGVRQPLAP